MYHYVSSEQAPQSRSLFAGYKQALEVGQSKEATCTVECPPEDEQEYRGDTQAHTPWSPVLWCLS